MKTMSMGGLSSLCKTVLDQVTQSVVLVEERVLWLGRKVVLFVLHNRLVIATVELCKKILFRAKKESSGKGLAQTVLQSEQAPLQRRYPPLSSYDTIIVTDGKMMSVHGQSQVFSDREIMNICPVTEEIFVHKVPISKVVESGKAVIQQQATRGCTAGAASMLIVDHGKEPSLRYLVQTNIGTTETMRKAIEAAGLTPLVKEISPTLSALSKAILEAGSAIVTISDDEIGGHVVIVDEVSPSFDRVTLRDPYHGWAIVVSGVNFLKHNLSNKIIQIRV